MLILLQLQERNCIFEVGSSGYNAFVSLLESGPMLCSNQIMMMNASHLTVHGITLKEWRWHFHYRHSGRLRGWETTGRRRGVSGGGFGEAEELLAFLLSARIAPKLLSV